MNQFAAERLSISLAKAVCAPSEWALHYAAKRGLIHRSAQTRVLPNPFDGFDSAADATSEDPMVIFLGRLDYLKGANLLPRIINGVAKREPDCHFRIIGQPMPCRRGFRVIDYRNWIKDQLRTDSQAATTFVDGVPTHALPEYMPRSAIACFMSTIETFGYTHLEAMSLGLATVIGSEGGARELGENGTHVVYIERKSTAAIDAIVQLIRDPELRMALGSNSARMVRERYSLDSTMDTYREFYSRIAFAA